MHTGTHTQISTNKGNGYGSRLWFLIDRIFDYMSILLFGSENCIMENACWEGRSRQTFLWQAVAFYGGIGKNVYIKSLLFFICSGKSLLACSGYGREKEENNSIQNVLQRKIFSVSGHPDYLFTSIG